MSLFNINNYDIKDKKRYLYKKPSGVVSSKKSFPVFEDSNKEYIFKPLSKTKPLSTPLFAYSEVYWSYLIKKYIDPKTPQYRLAICKGLTQENEKYYEKGTIVENVLKENEELINILELFWKYPDTIVNIDGYINYCEVQYNYENILNSTFFIENKALGEKLAEQILTSILRRDDNYHYENVSLIEENGKIKDIAPMIDMEFSEMFMYPDFEKEHKSAFSDYDELSTAYFKYDENKSYEENYEIFLDKLKNGSIYDNHNLHHTGNVRKNINAIVKLYPELVRNFISKLELMREEVEKLEIDFNKDFLGEFSSNDYQPNEMILKDGMSKTDSLYLTKLHSVEESRIKLDTTEFNKQLREEALWSINKLIETLKLYLDVYDNKIVDIKNYENKTLYGKLERTPEEELEFMDKFFNEIKAKIKK